MEFELSACTFATLLCDCKPVPDLHKHVGLIAQRHVRQLLRKWNKFVCGVGIPAKKFLADVATNHPQNPF